MALEILFAISRKHNFRNVCNECIIAIIGPLDNNITAVVAGFPISSDNRQFFYTSSRDERKPKICKLVK